MSHYNFHTKISNYVGAVLCVLFAVIFLLTQQNHAHAQSETLPEPTVNPVSCSADGTRATLSWNAVNEADTYALRVDDFDGNSSSCTDGWYCGTGADYLNDSYGATSYSVTNITPGETYEWWVHAKYDNTWDGISNWTKRTFSCAAPEDESDPADTETEPEPEPDEPPATPTNLSHTCNSDGTRVTLRWSNTDVYNSGYNINFSGANYHDSNEVFSRSITPGEHYTWQVQAKAPSGVGWSRLSSSRTFSCAAPEPVLEPEEDVSTDSTENTQKSPNQIPEPTVNPVSCSADGTRATLSWNAVNEADTYALRVDDFDGNSSSCTDGWYCGTGADYLNDSYGATSYSVTNITPGETYEWWVHAKYDNTWDGISNWTKRTFSCAAPEDESDPADTETDQSNATIDMAEYLNSSELASNQGIAVLTGGYPHQAKVTTLDNGNRIVFTGKNFGADHENYDVLSVNANTISMHYEVSESNKYVRRFVYESSADFSYEQPAAESGGALWTPRYPEFGTPYVGSHQIEYYAIDSSGNPTFQGGQSPNVTDMVIWVDRLEVDVSIPDIGYTSDHIVQLNQQWNECIVEQYLYAKNVGLVNWRPIYNIGCLDLQVGQTYNIFGDETGGVTYYGRQNGQHIFRDGNADRLQTMQHPDYHQNGVMAEYVHVRPETDTTYYSDVVSIDSDWTLTPDFVGTHVDSLPNRYQFTPLQDVNAANTSASAEAVSIDSAPSMSTAAFRQYMWVKTTDSLNVRSGPTVTAPVEGLVPAGTTGIIFGGPYEADGYTWWDVYYLDGTRGYSAGDWLTPRTFGLVRGAQTSSVWENGLVEQLQQLQHTLNRFLSTL